VQVAFTLQRLYFFNPTKCLGASAHATVCLQLLDDQEEDSTFHLNCFSAVFVGRC
jgi:hypothetical protein